MDLLGLTIKNVSEKLKDGAFSCKELIKECLSIIKINDKKINAFLTLNEDGALKKADEFDNLIKNDKEIFKKKPLLGIPMGVKDLYTTRGIITTAGSKIIKDYNPPFNATVIRRLIDAGVIIVGKTNEDAWGHGSSGENTDYEPTKNPYDLSRVPGGSSSGSGAAVSYGACLVGTGTDTGSSVRLPAGYCNLVGLKPTYGRVSRYGVIAMASSFDSIGHMTKTVYDNAKVLEVTAGVDPYDGTTVPIRVDKYTKVLGQNIKGLKIGLPKEYFVEGLDNKINISIRESLKVFEKLGATIEEITLPHTDFAMAAYYILVPSEVSSNLSRYDGVRYGGPRELFGAEAKRRIMLGSYTLSSGYYDAYYLKAAKVRTLIKQDFENAFKKVDVLIAPTSPTLPFKIGEKVNNPLQMYLSDIFLCPTNLAGIPGLNVPSGFADGLPVGMQIIGSQFSEELLYKVAYLFEQETQHYKIRPQFKNG
ncbi:MAG: Glutamyl-tRNA(Gln) amidotransferase subunit A [Candidatus Roizmanbacteria bacterium GW2011_GWA2_35_19]|uniref:Glutamyl-tRNA(Gln) amidotransferase subunit A n=2 Tax=Candidatus Roizmaniibacteriota TaxID=1752723 RepID=A0A0G0ED20_9BACT|nr:MAG: Glutamyl-tRNA(Gln) amidotransferase subunit A [Candidatus Roizmanbacteria bacterium GW2011_GWC2_35_12]KKP73095.1 MAG: Glutamyl-tRNA(Gln) amidotransferase subunit A [Candidatus Roizmanbacteria bacterium GW2011_GWA2_35_19]